ncbi:MAG: hypothetical protein ACKOWK_01605 [Micrococcales bacterium]
MEPSIPLLPKQTSLHTDWLRLELTANTALVRCNDSRTETLIYVVFGDDFIAGLRADRRTWVLLPARSVSTVKFSALAAAALPPVRQTNDTAREYLQGIGANEVKVWTMHQDEPLPSGRAQVEGNWLVLSRSKSGQAERLVSFDSISLIEVADISNSLRDLDLAEGDAR